MPYDLVQPEAACRTPRAQHPRWSKAGARGGAYGAPRVKGRPSPGAAAGQPEACPTQVEQVGERPFMASARSSPPCRGAASDDFAVVAYVLAAGLSRGSLCRLSGLSLADCHDGRLVHCQGAPPVVTGEHLDGRGTMSTDAALRGRALADLCEAVATRPASVLNVLVRCRWGSVPGGWTVLEDRRRRSFCTETWASAHANAQLPARGPDIW
jgi:hypothetical protein